jgi:putative membrane protein
MLEYIATLPNFLAFLGTSICLLVAFTAAYMLATPQNDLALIRRGNTSAAVVFGATVLGFALPLASAMAHSVNLLDLLLWGAIACAVQAIASILLRLTIRDLRGHVEADRIAVAMVMASFKIAFGLLNAAAVVY